MFIIYLVISVLAGVSVVLGRILNAKLAEQYSTGNCY